MLKIAVVTGSTRPGRVNAAVAHWVLDHAHKVEGAEFELVDIADFDLPLLDEPMPALMGQYSNEHTRQWAATVSKYDGYVFVTPEYNHSTSAALKNAFDYLNQEWNDKAAGFVGYGSAGGVRAVEHLRQIASEVRLAHVRDQVQLSLYTDFENFSTFKPQDMQVDALNTMLKDLVRWAGAMKTLR
ncbi:NADPH-dependent oxidoreductase [Natronospirillum operosum]|uniref:NADPH-dependent oxidoreductase n=1 Tax=Natronospirillum operosum TaxID=2759953 RepID=A0A4Z0WHA5_9GAMM|nr:NAD(P)H-dependent oxidoreductase [Natronospirillum operosum]TGG94168.1 NADPH-dependent oxidoreductase [Natronospirillum operosum]